MNWGWFVCERACSFNLLTRLFIHKTSYLTPHETRILPIIQQGKLILQFHSNGSPSFEAINGHESRANPQITLHHQPSPSRKSCPQEVSYPRTLPPRRHQIMCRHQPTGRKVLSPPMTTARIINSLPNRGPGPASLRPLRLHNRPHAPPARPEPHTVGRMTQDFWH